jgi:hypothetical protein
MTPRQTDETSEDDVQNQILQAIHEALNDSSEDETPLARMPQQAGSPQAHEQAGAADTRVELDRAEAYLRGPTAFSA